MMRRWLIANVVSSVALTVLIHAFVPAPAAFFHAARANLISYVEQSALLSPLVLRTLRMQALR